MIDKDYIQEMESHMEKYKNKISKLEKFLNDYKSEDKAHLVSETNSLKDKLKKGEAILKKLQSSTEENYEEIREGFVKSFDAIKEGFREFSTLLTMEQLWHAKDEVTEYGQEKIDELQDYIKKRPVLIASCALGLGLLVGAFLQARK